MEICAVFLLSLSRRCQKSKQLFHILHNRFKICFILLICFHIIRIIFRIRNFLIIKIGQEGIIIRSCKSNRQTSCLVIARYQDQGLFWMLFIELYRFFNRIVQGNGICNGRCCIVRMAGPVNLSALYHHEKSVFIVQHRDSLIHIICQRPLLFRAIQLICHSIAVSQMLINHDYLSILRLQCLCLCLCLYNPVSRLFCQCVQVLLILFRSGWF